MGIKVSSLPSLQTPIANTVLFGVDFVANPDRSVQITVANLQSVIVSSSFSKANSAANTANAAFLKANTFANTTNSAFTAANNASNTASFAFNAANTAASNTITLTSKSAVIFDAANTAYARGSIAYNAANNAANTANFANTKAQAAFDSGNNNIISINTTDTKAQAAFDAANNAVDIAQQSNTNATIAYNTAVAASSLATVANTNSIIALDRANTALLSVSNTEIVVNNIANVSSYIKSLTVTTTSNANAALILAVSEKELLTITGVVSAMSNAVDGYKGKSWEVKTAVITDANNSPRILGTPTIDTIGGDAETSTWKINSITANTETQLLLFDVVGENSTVIDWQASLFCSKVISS